MSTVRTFWRSVGGGSAICRSWSGVYVAVAVAEVKIVDLWSLEEVRDLGYEKASFWIKESSTA